jgi:hypothetical protein
MDSGKFDRLARFMAAAPSRRSVLRGLAGVVGAGAVAVVGQDAGAARDRFGSCNRNKQCPDNAVCRNDQCVCRSDFDLCRIEGRNRCVNLDTDNDNCGRCDRGCGPRKECRNGRCRAEDDGDGDGDGDGNCVIGGFCGTGRRPCCAGFSCTSGQPEAGLGGCTPN